MSDVPAPALDAARRWLAIHDEVAPALVEGMYLVGSAALGDWRPRSDLDIVAFTADPATDDDATLLRAAHGAATSELTIPVDGPRLAWADVSVPPLPLHRPWTLDGEFRHDGECFEINPVTWYTLAEHGIAVRGEPTERLGVATDADDRRTFVRENTDTYWRSVGEHLGAALADPTGGPLAAETVEWCALGSLRMLYTARTADVASKTAAGEWAIEQLPGHADVARRAIAIRTSIDPPPVDRAVLQAVHALVAEVVALVTGRPL